jgi:hypothetical protein
MAFAMQWIQHQLWDRHRLRTLRRTLKEIQEQGQLDGQGTLSVTSSLGRVPVSVVYFRCVPKRWRGRVGAVRVDDYNSPCLVALPTWEDDPHTLFHSLPLAHRAGYTPTDHPSEVAITFIPSHTCSHTCSHTLPLLAGRVQLLSAPNS